METTTPSPRDWKEWRRFRACELKHQGWSQHDIALALDASKGAVSQWIHTAEVGGKEALRSHPSPGHPAKLTPSQKRQLPEFLWHGAAAYGFRGEVWTSLRVAQVIEGEFGICYHKDHVSRGRTTWFGKRKPRKPMVQGYEVLTDQQFCASLTHPWEKIKPRVQLHP